MTNKIISFRAMTSEEQEEYNVFAWLFGAISVMGGIIAAIAGASGSPLFIVLTIVLFVIWTYYLIRMNIADGSFAFYTTKFKRGSQSQNRKGGRS